MECGWGGQVAWGGHSRRGQPDGWVGAASGVALVRDVGCMTSAPNLVHTASATTHGYAPKKSTVAVRSSPSRAPPSSQKLIRCICLCFLQYTEAAEGEEEEEAAEGAGGKGGEE